MNKKLTFRLLLSAQSLSAFGDNAVYSVIMGTLLLAANSGRIDSTTMGSLSAIYANCLFLPYVLFAPYLGWLTDRFTKKRVLVSANMLKALGCLVGLAGAAMGKDLMMASYLVIGAGAAVYSPSKYGIIPELKTREELVKANAAIEMTTIVSILLGVIGGSLMADHFGVPKSFGVLFAVYAAATLLNILMQDSGINNPKESAAASLHDFRITIRTIFRDKKFLVPLIGTGLFWAVAAFVKLNLQTWGQNTLKLGSMTSVSLLALWLSLGIIIGSFLAGRVFKTGQIKQSWYIALIMGVSVIALVFTPVSYALVVLGLVLVGTLGGLFVIPLNAAIQERSGKDNIGKVIATQNFFENGAMLISAGLFWLLNTLTFTPVHTFIFIGGILCITSVLWLRRSLRAL